MRALATGLSALLSDPARREELVRSGQVAVQDYDWDVVAKRTLAVYETVVSRVGGEVGVTTEVESPPRVES